MSKKISFKVTAETATFKVDPENYWDEWVEYWTEQNGYTPGQEVPEIDSDFLVEHVQTDIDEGNIDLSEVFEGYELKVEYAE